MTNQADIEELFAEFVNPVDHGRSDYFVLINSLVRKRRQNPPGSIEYDIWQAAIDRAYTLLADEIRTNPGPTTSPVKFGTSGWRGLLGKDLFARSVAQVTRAIIGLYDPDPTTHGLAEALGVSTLSEAQRRGCVLGFDNRFGGEILAHSAIDTLTGHGFTVHYAGESTTGVLSAALLELGAAFSINLTPSHNPLEYGGFKFNAADGGPAAPEITNLITANTATIVSGNHEEPLPPQPELVNHIDALAIWLTFVDHGRRFHSLDHNRIIDAFFADKDMVLAIDSVHGASRIHMDAFFDDRASERLIKLRNNADPTFGGIAPEPSSANMALVMDSLAARPEKLKLGVIIDPDADRIRFTDGSQEIDMNRFGAVAYHYLHERKGLRGLVAKSVATSNFANAIATGLGEAVFETRVGFKEFKPVIGRALVFFEESDGISIIGHTPEKDAYIGLLLAIDMTLTLRKSLGDYIREVEERFGTYFPDRDSITVSSQGEELLQALARLEHYREGDTFRIGDRDMTISKVIDIDGRKFILEDGSWLMIRPSGTEPKVRFYIEARNEAGRQDLFDTAQRLLAEIGLIN